MQTPDRVAEALFGKARRRILALLFGRPDESFYLREIARTTDVALRSVQRELQNLTQAGLITRSQRGQQVYFQADRNAPVFEDMRRLMEKTIGLAAPLRAALATLESRGDVALAFVHGSVASGQHGSASDVDLMVVGETSLKDVAVALRDAQDRLEREINPSVVSVADFQRRLAEGDHFITRVMQGPRIMLIGSEDDLTGLGGQRLAETP